MCVCACVRVCVCVRARVCTCVSSPAPVYLPAYSCATPLRLNRAGAEQSTRPCVAPAQTATPHGRNSTRNGGTPQALQIKRQTLVLKQKRNTLNARQRKIIVDARVCVCVCVYARLCEHACVCQRLRLLVPLHLEQDSRSGVAEFYGQQRHASART